jgi:diphthamide biosynthesis protein 2
MSKNKMSIGYLDNINEAKLGNFPEIQAYVIISCYRNALIDTKTYYKLVITPF